MPNMLVRTTMAANGQSYPLQGKQFEILSYPALVKFAVFADTGATVNYSVYSGSDLLQQLALCPILAVASPLIVPDHYSLQDVAGRGERLSVELNEGAAGTPIVRTGVIIDRIAA